MSEQRPRQQRLDARKAQMASLKPKRQTVRVTAASDELRRCLKHPKGIRFPTGGGSVEWPLDRFTRRRIADGSVTVEGETHAHRRTQHRGSADAS